MNARNTRFTKAVKQPMLTGVSSMITDGQRKQYLWSGLKMDEDEMNTLNVCKANEFKSLLHHI